MASANDRAAVRADMSTAPACAVCGGGLRARKSWLNSCETCGFLCSTLIAGAGTGIEGLEDLRRANFETLLDRLAALRPLSGLSLLEVGSAWGWFLEAAARRGARAHGIEPEAANADASRRRGACVETGLFPGGLSDRGPYDLIVFNDVFEHIPDPAATIRAVEAVLAPGGLAVLNLPSSDGALYRIGRALDAIGASGPYERLWQKGFPSPHISYFNPGNLRSLVEGGTALRRIDTFALQTVMRRGLYARIRSSNGPVAAAAMTAGVLALSYVLPALPADIHVGVFEKPATA